jgi:iron(III) transport system ATP-binding protein
MGREVAVLRAGRLAQRAAPTALYRTPADADVAQFVGEATLSAGAARAGEVLCALGRLAIANPGLEGEVEVMIRPEQIRIERAASNGDGVGARVLDYAYYGPDTVVRLSLEQAPGTVVKARTFDHQVPVSGEAVRLVVRGPVVVFPARATAGGETHPDPAGPPTDEPKASAT